MAIAELVRDYLDVVLSWPTVGLILGAMFLYLFRQDLRDLFRRLGKVQGYGITLEAAKPTQQEQEAPTPLGPDPGTLVEQVRRNPEQALVALGRLWNSYRWERALNRIFGSQLDLLRRLQEQGEQGERYINLLPFFQSFLARGGSSGTQMADYLSFLVGNGFVEYVEREGEQFVRITPYGVDFLSYLSAEYPNGMPFRAY